MTTAKRRTGALVYVVCALIVEGGKLLVVQYGPGSKHPGKWEFPGGKVHAGESQEEALEREIREELGTGVKILFPLDPVEYIYPYKKIRLIPFVCQYLGESILLSEHQNLKWVDQEELPDIDLLEADRELLKCGNNPEVLSRYIFNKNGKNS